MTPELICGSYFYAKLMKKSGRDKSLVLMPSFISNMVLSLTVR